MKNIGLCLCFHKPGVVLICTFLYFDKLSSSNDFAKIPAFGNTYIPYINLMYAHSSFVAFFKPILLDEIFRKTVDFQSDVFVSRHGCIEVEVLDI